MKHLATIWASVLALLCFARVATAQDNEGFALDRFEPSERGSEWFMLDTLDMRGHVRPAIGLVGDYGYKPLAFYDANGNETKVLVQHQIYAHVGASLVLWERLRLGVNLPIALYTKGNTGTSGGVTFSAQDGTTIGDIRLAADIRLFGEYRSPISMAVGAGLWLPTGKQESFTGDGKVRVAPRLTFAGEVGPFAYSARAGFNVRAQDGDFNGQPVGNEILWAAAAGLRFVDGHLLLGPEIYGSSVLEGGVFEKRGSPVEGVLGFHYTAGDWRFGAGAGPGLTRGLGSPVVRVLAMFEWAPQIEKEAPPPPPPSDRDGDGIIDPEDACPNAAGPRNEDPKKNGCPEARIEKGQIRIIEQVKFKTGSDVILPESNGILQAVLNIMKEHPEIGKLGIEGHTDNRGAAQFNKNLSKKRAASVVRWLTGHGIAADRLQSAGYGMDRPLDSNDTEEGRAANRRVEFHIVEMDGKPYDASND